LRVKRFVFAGAFALAAVVASPAVFAAPCGGFTDVDDTNPAHLPFCGNVEWVKNRSVTLGCASPPNPPNSYCPNDPVTRLSMAAFMNRLGTALTPVFLRQRQSAMSLGALNYSAAQTVCASFPVPPSTTGFDVTGFPRAAIITAMLNAFTPDGPFDLRAQIVYSTTNGATWLPVPTGDGLAYGSLYQNVPGTIIPFAPPNDISLRPFTFMDLNVGSSYRFAVQGLRIAGTGAIAQTECELHVQIVNRNGTLTPLDVAPESAEPPRGG
jgi:hypothetical protein